MNFLQGNVLQGHSVSKFILLASKNELRNFLIHSEPQELDIRDG